MTNGNASIHHMYLLYTALGCGSTPTTEGAVVLPALTIPPEITQQANQGSQWICWKAAAAAAAHPTMSSQPANKCNLGSIDSQMQKMQI